ncbi:MAG: hypothetical protein ACRD0P_26670 [Stackebrandtia sp.]
MAASSASRSWATFARRAVVTGAVAAIGTLALAIPASAHKPDAKAGCDKKTNTPVVSVEAVSYELNKDEPQNLKPNSVKIFVDGADKAAIEEGFGVNLKKTFTFDKLDARAEHSFKVVVMAWNDKDIAKEPFWSKVFNLRSEICDKTPPPSNPPTPPENPPANPPVNNAPPPAPQAAPATNALADTGVSIAVPLGFGALLLVGGAAMLLVMRKRGKA